MWDTCTEAFVWGGVVCAIRVHTCDTYTYIDTDIDTDIDTQTQTLTITDTDP